MPKRPWLSLKEKHRPPLPTRGHKIAMNAGEASVGFRIWKYQWESPLSRPVSLICKESSLLCYLSKNAELTLDLSNSPRFLFFPVHILHPLLLPFWICHSVFVTVASGRK